jgi:hypothetical protein
VINIYSFQDGGIPFRGLASGRHRRMLVGAYAGVGMLLAVSPFLPTGLFAPDGYTYPKWAQLLGLAPMLAWFGALAILQRSTHHLTDGPATALDEMMMRLRHRAMARAYHLLLFFLAPVVVVLTDPTDSWNPPHAVKASLFLAFLVVAAGLPPAVTALTLPDIDPEP